MFKERGRVKVKATGMYGTIIDWRFGSDRCEVELDGWQRNALPDEEDLLLRTFSLSDLDELVEVSGAERKAVFESFDTLVISAYQQRAFLRSPVVVIRREGDVVRASVNGRHFSRGFESRGFETKEVSIVESADVSKLLSAIFATHADRWVERFEPDYGVLDGYSWTMSVYAGNRYFECDGGNYAPDELVDLLYAVHEVGLPLVWNNGGIVMPDVLE